MHHDHRIKRLKDKLLKEKLDGILVSKAENIHYLSGFGSADAVILITAKDRDFLITDSRFIEEARDISRLLEPAIIKTSREESLAEITRRLKLKKVGFESDWLTYGDHARFAEGSKRTRFIPTGRLIEDMRTIKEIDEIRLIKESTAITKKAYLHAKGRVGPKMNGAELAVIIDNALRRYGASGPAFPTIAAQNPDSARPHASCPKRAFGRDSAIVVDMGAVRESYTSDLTRVIFLGRIPTQLRHIYSIILVAQKKAIEKIRPGIRASRIDGAARQYIESKGYGRYFLHSLGHGIGLEVHESPRISKNSKTILAPGMVFTVEPGIYISGVGGIRIEDIVAVTEKGYEVLTDDIPK